jgi:hypothetical protein
LPIEDLNPSELLPFIPEGNYRLFESLALDYMSLDMPGKALILMIEAL